MRRYGKMFLSLTVVLLSMPVCLWGRDGAETKVPSEPFRYEFRLGWGTFPLVDAEMFSGALFPDEKTFFNNYLDEIYRDYDGPKYITGLISAEFNMILLKWLTLSFGVGVNGMYGYTCSGKTGAVTERYSGASVSFLPQARFTYISRKYFKMYSSAGIGFAVYALPDVVHALPDIQVSPVGIMAGHKVFGFFELGIGTRYMGCMAGIGFRF